MHLPPPNLPRFGGGERPPFSCKPPAPLTITMGQRLVLFASPISLRALNFPFSIARPSGPLSRLGKGGGGKGQMLPQATLGAILCAVRIDFRFHRKSIRIQHSQRQGSWGSAPSVFCFGAPDGSQDPVGKGGAAERWRVAQCASRATRREAQPATTHTSKRNATAASRTDCHLLVTSPRRRRLQTFPCPRRAGVLT